MYILEGNIGAGKSTLLNLVEKHCQEIQVVQEPQENWFVPTDGTSLFESFYKNPQRWAYTIETLIMACRVKNHIIAQQDTNPNRIMERSIYSGHLCFAQNGFNSGFFSNIEWDAYLKIADFLIKNQCKTPLGFIYLQAEPKTCQKRVKIRNRSGEESLSLDYLINIHNLHEKFLIKKELTFENIKNIPILVLDANYDFIENQELMHDMLDKIKKFTMDTQIRHNLLLKPAAKLDLAQQLKNTCLKKYWS
jgi:deoxyadenosine/deoxycytidine kinase